MRSFLLAVLVTGCSEHGSMPPDVDARKFLDATVNTCFAPDGSASVTASPSSSFGRIYAGGVFGSGLFAPAAGAPFTLRLLITNAVQADLGIFGACDGLEPSCTTDGLAVISTAALELGAEVGSHPVSIRRTIGGTAPVDGALNITEFVDPFESQPGHIAGTVSGVGPALTVSGSFGTAFCPPFLEVLI